MRVRTMQLVAGVSAPLIAAPAVTAGFLGIFPVVKSDVPGIATVSIYAVFDRPGEDRMLVVAGTANNPMNIEVVGGTFYQHPFGTDKAPPAALVEAFPSLAFDTFVTIGVKKVGEPGGQPADLLTLTPGFQIGPSSIAGTSLGWAVTPIEPQGDPFDPVNSFPGDGTILIGQFSTADGIAIQGTMLLQFLDNGVITQSTGLFSVGFECDDDLLCSDGDPCNGVEFCDGTCQAAPPTPDCNGNGVLDSCDIDDGTSDDDNGNGVPDECEVCKSDVDGDGVVGINDFLGLLAAWGPCPPAPEETQ